MQHFANLAGWAAVLGFAALTLGPFGLATRALTARPPNWIQTDLAPRGETKPVGLIESFGVRPQTPGRLRRKNVAGGSAPRQSPAARPRSGVWGRAPQWGSGGGATSNIIAAKPSLVLGGAPPPPPPLWLRHSLSLFFPLPEIRGLSCHFWLEQKIN